MVETTLNLTQLKELAEDKAIEFFNADRLDHYEERLVNGRSLEKLTVGGLIQAIRGLHRQLREVDRLKAAIQSRHDYGPASPGEQEAGWHLYCKATGWSPDSHPSAKSAFTEGFCMGDMFSEGDDSREVLRDEVARLLARIRTLEG